MIGKTLGHYEILALIGRGGMGEVYRARDTRLDRDVALKVLPRDVAKDPARLERFLREARMVAGLNHPHIVTLHSVEESGGIRFITMELVEGQPLEALLTTEGLPLKRVMNLEIGDTLMLELKPDAMVSVRCGDVTLSEGRMGRVGDRVAVRVAKPLRRPRTTLAMFEKAESSKRVEAS